MTNKNILAIGMSILLILNIITPMTMGYNIKLERYEESQSSTGNGGLMDSAWPMYCHDARHTGISPYGKEGNYYMIKWKCWIEQLPNSSPAIDKNGTIYIGGGDWEFLAIYPNGTVKWKYETGGSIESSPAIAEDGTIYVGCNNGYLLAFDENGKRKWRVQICHGGIYSSPVIDENGTIYVAGVPGRNIVAVNPNGTKKWSYYTNDRVYDEPAIDENGILYCGSNDGFLYAIFKDNGTLKWKYKTKYDSNSPTIGDDGIIYFCSNDRYLRALYPDGTLKWKFCIGWDALTSSPALGVDGNIYFGCHAGYIYSVNASTGKENWRYPTYCDQFDQEVSAPVAIDKYGIIYAGDWDGNFYAINPDGTARWKFKTGNAIFVSPVIAEDGAVYIASWDGYLYALEIIEIHNEPPLKPTLDGPSEGKAREEYTFFANTTDPDEQKISYFFDWEYEHENSGWLDFVPSGTTITINQTFYLEGTYTVKVKAQDRYGSESPWETMEIKITNPRTRESTISFHWLLNRFPMLDRLLGFFL